MIERAERRQVHQMFIGYLLQRRFVPRRRELFPSGDTILPPAPLARELERLDPIVHLGEVRRLDRARAPRPTARNRFVLERFHELLMLEGLLGRGHVAPIVSPRGRTGKLSFS
ncbi:MAG: hypothetical protein E6K64_05130 [Nitrospirae bacterium]|nr:MAG: hypothetical protein E6K64_05130 [Nitrospirota bacterium]